MNKIGVDLRCLQEEKTTGVQEYALGLVRFLLEAYPQNRFYFFTNSFQSLPKEFDWLEKYPNVQLKHFRVPNKLLNFSFWWLNWPAIDRLLGGVDILIFPNLAYTAFSWRCRRILVVHDLSFEYYSEHFSLKRRLWHFLLNPRQFCHRSNKIIAVSQSTKEDLMNYYGIAANKIRIGYPPLRLEAYQQAERARVEVKNSVRKKYQLPDNYILFLGTIEPRKNITTVIKAFEHLKQEGKGKEWEKELKLVIAGGKGWLWEKILERVKKSPWAKEIILTGFVDAQDKPLIYAMAKIFLYPSFFEGFGIPPVEAMAAGTPVITANCSSLPEVTAGAAILTDPSCSYEITLALKELLQDDSLREEIIIRGKQRISELMRRFQQPQWHLQF